TYTLDNANADTQALAQGDTATDVFQYTTTDEHGATSTSTLTITIAGTNDAPVANDFAVSNATPSGDGWILDTDNGHYYRLVTTSLSWSDANAVAQSDGAYLATITSQAEQDFVATLATG